MYSQLSITTLQEQFPFAATTLGTFSDRLFICKRQQVDHYGAIVLARLDSPLNSTLAVQQYFSDVEAVEFRRMQSPVRRQSFLAGRLCAKMALTMAPGVVNPHTCSIQKGVFDFPVLTGLHTLNNWQVSISHTKRYAGAVVFQEKHPMALDIELISDQIAAFGEDTITTAERTIIYQSTIDEDTLFSAFWCAKEAISKIMRTGLMTPFSIYEMNRIHEHEFGYELHYKHFTQYKCHIYKIDNHVLAVTLPRNSDLEFFEGTQQ